MSRNLWINLPVADRERSKAFFEAIGFEIQPQHPGTDGAGMVVGDQRIQVMLFPETTFRKFTRNDLPDTGKATEVLFSFSAESREEVDALAASVEEAGGTLFAEPEESPGGMYGCGFADPDGHRWNMLYMGPGEP